MLNKSIRIPALIFVISLYLVLMTWLVILFCSRFQYQKGITAFKIGEFAAAEGYFSKARKILPEKLAGILAARDLFRLDTAMGKTLYSQALEAETAAVYYRLVKRGLPFLEAAVAHDRLSYRTAYWMAKTVEGLENAYPMIFPTHRSNPYDALPLFETAISLRPNGISVHYDLANYLYGKGEMERLPGLAETMARIYPPSCGYLKKEPYYSEAVRESLKRGLTAALDEEIMPKAALAALSAIALEEGDIEVAVAYYRDTFKYEEHKVAWTSHAHMGMLLLKNRQIDEGIKAFLSALKESTDLEKSLNRIYAYFKGEKLFEEFTRFSLIVEKRFYASEGLDLLTARCWVALDQPELARARLIQMNARQPSSRAYELMARIAQNQKDWDAMELASQRATVLEPGNPGYHILFSTALKQQENYFGAEKAATRALEAAADKPSPGYYSHRAWIRWSIKHYQGAVEDWEEAAKLRPQNPGYPYHISRAYGQMKQFDQALAYIDKALELKPGNSRYVQWQSRLLKETDR